MGLVGMVVARLMRITHLSGSCISLDDGMPWQSNAGVSNDLQDPVMTTMHVPYSQQSPSSVRENFFEMNRLCAGSAISLRSRRPMRLSLLAGSGGAWLTQTRPGATSSSDDLILLPGQTLAVGPGEHWVMEPVTAQAVRYQWK